MFCAFEQMFLVRSFFDEVEQISETVFFFVGFWDKMNLFCYLR